MPEPTSPGGGAMPPTTSPATGTPAPGSATPPVAALTLEEALKRIADLEQHAQNKTEEASRHGTRLTAAEKELAAYKAAEDAARAAQMSELDKAQKAAADLATEKEQLAAELYEARVYQEVGKLASKFNFVISAETLAKMLLLDDDAIEFEDGKPTNVEKLLDKLAKREPDLVKQPAQPGTPQASRPGAPAVPAMNPGRSSITSPGQAQPGRIPRLDDIQWSR